MYDIGLLKLEIEEAKGLVDTSKNMCNHIIYVSITLLTFVSIGLAWVLMPRI